MIFRVITVIHAIVLQFEMKQIESIFKNKNLIEIEIDNDYNQELYCYLIFLESNGNYIFTLEEYLKNNLLISNNIKTDQYNLVILDTE